MAVSKSTYYHDIFKLKKKAKYGGGRIKEKPYPICVGGRVQLEKGNAYPTTFTK